MRGLARFVATSTLVIGCLAALVLVIAATTALNDYGTGTAAVLFGWAFGVFLTAGASACVLSLLASIDERLQVAGHVIGSDAAVGGASVFEQQVGPIGAVAAAPDDELDDDLESKLNFQRTHRRG